MDLDACGQVAHRKIMNKLIWPQKTVQQNNQSGFGLGRSSLPLGKPNKRVEREGSRREKEKETHANCVVKFSRVLNNFFFLFNKLETQWVLISLMLAKRREEKNDRVCGRFTSFGHTDKWVDHAFSLQEMCFTLVYLYWNKK